MARKSIKGKKPSYFSRKTKKGSIRTKTKSLIKLINKISLNKAETKNTHIIQEDQQLYHNQQDIKKGLLNTTASVNDGQGGTANTAVRIGDEICAKGLSIKMWFANKLDRPNIMYKVVFFYYQSDSNVFDIFYSQGSTNLMLRDLNTEKYTIITAKTFNLQVGESSAISGGSFVGREAHRLLKFWIPLKNKKIKYHDTTDVPKFRNIGFMVCAYDSFGTLITDNIASYSYNYKLYFKDP